MQRRLFAVKGSMRELRQFKGRRPEMQSAAGRQHLQRVLHGFRGSGRSLHNHQRAVQDLRYGLGGVHQLLPGLHAEFQQWLPTGLGFFVQIDRHKGGVYGLRRGVYFEL